MFAMIIDDDYRAQAYLAKTIEFCAQNHVYTAAEAGVGPILMSRAP
jgi:hypothetical protein